MLLRTTILAGAAVALVSLAGCDQSPTTKPAATPPQSAMPTPAPSVPATPPAPTSSATNTVSGSGFGAMKFGMKVEDAERALGVTLKKDTYAESESCRYFTPVGSFEGLSFMTSDGVVVRLDVIRESKIATDKGAKIGDSEQSVLDLYKGNITVQPHKYTGPEGHYLVVTGADGKAQIVFETDGKVVTMYRAGQEPQVQYVEGCS